jgi:hypothetical protein
MSKPQEKPSSLATDNPFFHRGPIRDHHYFYGRAKEANQTLKLLGEGQCVSVVGPRRIGKTSLLFHLCDPKAQKDYAEKGYRFIYVDCQGLGDTDKLQFYERLWKGTREQLAKHGEADNSWGESISNFRDLRDAMEMVQRRGHKPIFIFDEFESLATSKYMDKMAFYSLRNLHQELGIPCATASQMSLDELTYHDHSVLHSPFFSNFVTIPLGFLEPSEAEQMVRDLAGIGRPGDFFSGKDLSFGFEMAGYHPFFLQLAFYYLFEQKIEHADLAQEDYEAARREYAEDAERFFRYTWHHLGREEHQALSLVCYGRIDQLDEAQKRQLRKKCILFENVFFSTVFAEYACRQVSLEVIPQPLTSTSTFEPTSQESSEPKTCQLNIVCNKHGSVSVFMTGSFSYEGDSSGKVLDAEYVDRFDRHATDALYLQGWRFQIKETGRTLFEELILNRPEIAKAYHRAVAHDRQTTLALHAPRHYLRFPFEALYGEDEGGYLCLKYPMYRMVSGCFFDKPRLSLPSRSQNKSKAKPPRALVVASNTWSAQAPPIPEVEREAKEVSQLLARRGFDVCMLLTDEATEQRVRNELARGDYLLFHYAGHGAYNPDSPEKGGLYFWDGPQGKSGVIKLAASQLADLAQGTPLSFAYLSNCWGSHTAPPVKLLDDDFLGVMDGLVMGGVPAVLGFRWPVSDNGARLLAHAFYSTWLGEEKRLDKALCQARGAVADQMGLDERAWFSPILVMRGPDN